MARTLEAEARAVASVAVIIVVISAFVIAMLHDHRATIPPGVPDNVKPGERFYVGGTDCRYIKVHNMWCLTCYHGVTCDWRTWNKPESLGE